MSDVRIKCYGEMPVGGGRAGNLFLNIHVKRMIILSAREMRSIPKRKYYFRKQLWGIRLNRNN